MIDSECQKRQVCVKQPYYTYDSLLRGLRTCSYCSHAAGSSASCRIEQNEYKKTDRRHFDGSTNNRAGRGGGSHHKMFVFGTSFFSFFSFLSRVSNYIIVGFGFMIKTTAFFFPKGPSVINRSPLVTRISRQLDRSYVEEYY